MTLLHNVELLFRVLSESGLDLTDIVPRDIVDGKAAPTLELLRRFIHLFQVSTPSGSPVATFNSPALVCQTEQKRVIREQMGQLTLNMTRDDPDATLRLGRHSHSPPLNRSRSAGALDLSNQVPEEDQLG